MRSPRTMKALGVVLAFGVLAFAGFTANAKDNTQDTSKYGKYIITDLPSSATTDQAGEDAEAQTLGDRIKNMTMGLRELNDKVVKGGMYMDVAWIMKANPGKVWVKAHAHPSDEVLVFLGTDPKHPDDLGAVIDIYIGGEKHTLTKPALVYVPKGIEHCPLIIQKVDRPVLFLTTGTTTGYQIEE